MEEVSYFQRVIQFETPESFVGNMQGEFNLHNFNTRWSEIIYYFGSIVFFVILPFIIGMFKNTRNYDFVEIMTPSTDMIIIGSLISCYNYAGMWNHGFIAQFSLYSCFALTNSDIISV